MKIAPGPLLPTVATWSTIPWGSCPLGPPQHGGVPASRGARGERCPPGPVSSQGRRCPPAGDGHGPGGALVLHLPSPRDPGTGPGPAQGVRGPHRAGRSPCCPPGAPDPGAQCCRGCGGVRRGARGPWWNWRPVSSAESPLAGTPGLVAREGGHIVEGPAVPLLEDLDELPTSSEMTFPILGLSVPYQLRHLTASRGCAAACIFCRAPNAWGRRVRRRTVASFLAEVATLRRERGLVFLSFRDDTFTADPRGGCRSCAGGSSSRGVTCTGTARRGSPSWTPRPRT